MSESFKHTIGGLLLAAALVVFAVGPSRPVHRKPASKPEIVEHDIESLVYKYSLDHDLDPRLVMAVIEVESGFDSRAVSGAGAQGLMQLMPRTMEELGVSRPFDPEDNIRGGTRYLKVQLDRFGSVHLALAAYNAGPTAVRRYGGVPPYPQTRSYVRRVMAAYDRLKTNSKSSI